MYVTPLRENPDNNGEAAVSSCPWATSRRLMEGEKIGMCAFVMLALESSVWTARRFTPQLMLPVIHNSQKNMAVYAFSGMLVAYQLTLEIYLTFCPET